MKVLSQCLAHGLANTALRQEQTVACQACKSWQRSFHSADAVVEVVLLRDLLPVDFGLVEPYELLGLLVELLLDHSIAEQHVEADQALVGFFVVNLEFNSDVLHFACYLSQVLVCPNIHS